MPRIHPTGSAARATVLAVAVGASALLAFQCPEKRPEVGSLNFTSPQSNPITLSPDGRLLFVANTTSDSVSVIDTASRKVVTEVPVGLEPVSVEARPDGHEVWVSNHVSDSVSVIDTRGWSPTRFSVTHTVQDIDEKGVTWFDEPVGIAFSSGKAYVALSSRNQIAVIDPDTYQVTGHIEIHAQDPRAITARDGYLYVVAFESTNQTQISGCRDYDPPQCTLGSKEIGDFITMPNLPGVEKNIVVDPDIPDRDLFVIDTSTDTVVDVVEHIGTLLYGVAVDSARHVYITQTDARNAVNGLDGDNLVVLQNRMFDNQIAVVDCGGPSCGGASIIALDPALPTQPTRAEALATPYGIRVSGDDDTLFVTAMGTSRLFSVDAATRAIEDRLDLGPDGQQDGQEMPKGVALASRRNGAPETAYVLNTLDNSVSVVDVSDPTHLVQVDRIPVGHDPTPENVRKGRIAFMNAFASDSNTFSCESCHPDGNTDQLLWSIGGACFFGACTGNDDPRTTMPVRGLRDTLPLHWDGSLGDPFGGRNGAVGPNGNLPPSCTDDHSCFRNLIDATFAGVLCNQDPACATGPSGLPGRFTEEERDDMADFLASVSYPPARSRAMDDVLSDQAVKGFDDFFVDHGGIGSLGGGTAGVSTCADMDNGCHALPLLSSTNTNTLQGFDAPTLRGLPDRFVQFSMALSSNLEALQAAAVGGGPAHPENNIPFLNFVLTPAPSPLPFDPNKGFEEDVVFEASFAAFGPIYNVDGQNIFHMLEEMSTGFSGAIGRQVTLSKDSTTGGALASTEALMQALEAADHKGVVNLRGEGRWLPLPFPADFTYEDTDGDGFAYVDAQGGALSHAQVLALAESGHLVLTLTADLPPMYGEGGDPQPLLRPAFDNTGPTGSPALPLLPHDNPMTLRGKYVRETAQLLVDGQPADGTVTCLNGSFAPYCSSGFIVVSLADPPMKPLGIHTLQVQNPDGPLSNEMPLCRADVPTDCL